jgi:sulfur relay protein TusB/DsrH
LTENKDIIYLFGYSERMGKHLERLVPLLKAQIAKGSRIGLIFIHDGVINSSSRGKILDSVKQLFNSEIELYTLIPDLKARGISLDHVHETIKPIEYDELIDIIDATPKLISWM